MTKLQVGKVAKLIDGVIVRFSLQEWMVFREIYSHHGDWCSRENIVDELFRGRHDGGPENTRNLLGKLICCARKKLAPTRFRIKNSYQRGYAIERLAA